LTKNNKSGFLALPGGYRYYDGSFYDFGYYGGWWNAAMNDASSACHRGLYCGYDAFNRHGYNHESCGFSMRLLRDN
jgi:uncharacterized protein (TIGR02145 family)